MREHGAQDAAACRGSGNRVDAGGGEGVVSEALEALREEEVGGQAPQPRGLMCVMSLEA